MSIIVSLIIFEFLLFLYSEALHCYNCASTLPANISKDAQRAFKTVLYSTFMVPPVDRLCNNSNDVEFITVKQISCSPNDQCIKITFVMRSCQALIYRGKMIGDDVECRHDRSPSICRCSSYLCNSALRFSLCSYISSLAFFMILSSFANV
uniref:Protein quiver n=1 Tax=Elaeophora elaphi TaxID=1147741 RepID=A0A0R3S189_9BILA